MVNEEKISKLKPREIFKVLDAYMTIKKKSQIGQKLKLPLVQLVLSSGVVLTGDILDCDFSKNSLLLSLIDSNKGRTITYIEDFKLINAISFINIDQCGELIDELSKKIN